MTIKLAPITTPITTDILFGALELECTDVGLLPHRLPAQARARNDDPQLAMAEAQPSGVRLMFRTSAVAIELDTLPTKRDYIGMPARPAGVYDLRVDGRLQRQESASGGKVQRINMATASAVVEPGQPQTLRFCDLPGHDKTVEIWLPHDETTELVALRSDAPITPVGATGKRVWLHHGSSISQGSNAASPTGTWPVIAANLAEVELINLGFGGSAVLDPFVARTMRDTPADLISVKIGINLVNTDLMRLRAFGPAVHGFLDTVRDGHPTTPLLVVSPVFCPIHETVPGPSQADILALQLGRLLFRAAGNAEDVSRGKLTLTIIREQLRAIVQRRSGSDANIHYLDGTELYGEADHDRLPLPDQLHPDADTHRLIGERFANLAAGPFRQRYG
ncbi:SGNH/GDSL hydrolase family protein [Pseudaminobacter soli (ex Li et al. 2025)]|uniref:Lipase n=1 Tax=Pseudaminobacter soli (ex Li et al. 2025) TaxID=1295366 RepID=A0A2P7S2I9_9HYPH|nr:SGNH/GDSL hydrolase family protein [Mesorhizobium soli]PSJ56646.1 lipase [Mesorhizobium soli]